MPALAPLMLTWVAGLVLVLTTQNVAHSLSTDHARHDVHHAAERSSVVLAQEMGHRHAAHLAPAGWGTAHASGTMRGDCATYWDRQRWHLVRSWVRQLTYAPFRAGHRWAQVTVLRGRGTTVAVVCLHLVTRGHRATYRRGITRLHHLLAALPQRHVVVGGDWNAPRWRVRLAWPCTGPFHTGPHGGEDDRLCWRRASHLASWVVRRTYSDHEGMRVRLALH